jgi:NitT/TauT family transport system substrate-binding protein
MQKRTGRDVMNIRTTRTFAIAAFAAAATLALALPARAETVKVGITPLMGYAGVPVADALGYFKAEGITIQPVEFHSAAPIGVAVASGDADFGVSGMSASFYTLASHGQLRLIASASQDHPGFHTLLLVGSNKAWDAGLKSPKDLPGHSVGVTQVGTSLEYSVGLIAQRWKFPFDKIEIKPLQSNPNVVSALKGGTLDAALMPAAPVLPLIAQKQVHLLGYVGDICDGFGGSMLFTSTALANSKPDLVKRFLVAYRKAMGDLHNAFVGPKGERRDGPLAAKLWPILTDFTHLPAKQLEDVVPYFDPKGRVDLADVGRQIAWYKSQQLLKGDVEPEKIVDKRFADLMHPTGS